MTKYRTTKNKWDKCKKNNYKYEIIKMRQNRKEQNTNRTKYKCDKIQKQQNNNHKKQKGQNKSRHDTNRTEYKVNIVR